MTGCTQQSGTCTECRSACTGKPGWFLPGESERAAELLGMDFREFFAQHLMVDWWNEPGDGPDTYVLSPAVVEGDPGEEFPRNPNGTCVFFQDGDCRIHDAKPHECAAYWCGELHGANILRHARVRDAWRSPEHQAQITDLLGREPESRGNWSIFDAMGIWG